MKILIVDDHPLARRGIISILSESKGISSIIEAINIKEALSIIKKEIIDIVILDLKLGKEDGLGVVAKGKDINDKIAFIILSSFISQSDFLRAEELGVAGYVLKDAMAEDILYVVDLIIRGKKYYDPDIIKYYKKDNEDSIKINVLTEREKEVLLEISKGFSNEEIAGQLYISQNTVKKHISSILSKLNLKHRTQAALFVKEIEL